MQQNGSHSPRGNIDYWMSEVINFGIQFFLRDAKIKAKQMLD